MTSKSIYRHPAGVTLWVSAPSVRTGADIGLLAPRMASNLEVKRKVPCGKRAALGPPRTEKMPEENPTWWEHSVSSAQAGRVEGKSQDREKGKCRQKGQRGAAGAAGTPGGGSDAGVFLFFRERWSLGATVREVGGQEGRDRELRKTSSEAWGYTPT